MVNVHDMEDNLIVASEGPHRPLMLRNWSDHRLWIYGSCALLKLVGRVALPDLVGLRPLNIGTRPTVFQKL